jgi:glycerophosphoryl diester phosphodiesterase
MRKLIFILPVFFTLLALFMLKDFFLASLAAHNMPLPQRNAVKIIAHRGASGYAPENTLPAFELALSMGADILELDVHLSADGHLVVMHDADLARTTGVKGAIASSHWEALSQLDAGSWYGENFAGTKIPELQQVLAMAKGKAQVLIELKNDTKNRPYPGLADAVIATLDRLEAWEMCIIQSFEPFYLRDIHQKRQEAVLHHLIVAYFSPLPIYFDTHLRWGKLFRATYCQAINPFYKSLSKGKIALWKNNGLGLFTYTVNQEAQMRKLLGWGVDGLITDFPDRAAGLWQLQEVSP